MVKCNQPSTFSFYLPFNVINILLSLSIQHNKIHHENISTHFIITGHSLKAPVGRWQKGKDLQWFNKERTEGRELTEAEAVRQAEKEALMIALGQKPPVKRPPPAESPEEEERYSSSPSPPPKKKKKKKKAEPGSLDDLLLQKLKGSKGLVFIHCLHLMLCHISEAESSDDRKKHSKSSRKDKSNSSKVKSSRRRRQTSASDDECDYQEKKAKNKQKDKKQDRITGDQEDKTQMNRRRRRQSRETSSSDSDDGYKKKTTEEGIAEDRRKDGAVIGNGRACLLKAMSDVTGKER
eukprot:XP_011664739.1 PREDICTED: multiple myeloma tumor-associated protein 2 homolog [Strongylocentrotus purpuratus]